ncbi:MAG: Flp pilus assembly protein CpaB [Sandaracinaceae bacterium]|nr:Flp pilus assembly protein CpaB [Sandaracinaceae bacterium]
MNLIISLLLLLGGTATIYLYQSKFVYEKTGGAFVEIVVATRDIPLGEPIRAEWVGTRSIPAKYVEERHILVGSIRDLIGIPLAQSVRSGEAILRTDLSPLSDHQRTLSAVIPTGSRAVVVEASATSLFNGLLKPGDRVDVLLTVGDLTDRFKWRTSLLLQNVLVLAVGRQLHEERLEEGDRGYRLGQARSVTLQVTFEEGALLAHAQEHGRIQLVLRNPSDSAEIRSPTEITSEDVTNVERILKFQHRHYLSGR